jgi:hypothetical protein
MHDDDTDDLDPTSLDEPIPDSVTVGGRTLPTRSAPGGHLVVPSSLAVLSEVVLLAPRAPTRAAAAALGVCWRGPGTPKTRLEQCQYDLALYGGRVLDELVARGGGTPTAFAEVMSAGGVALRMILDKMPREQEVATLADFSAAHEAG